MRARQTFLPRFQLSGEQAGRTPTHARHRPQNDCGVFDRTTDINRSSRCDKEDSTAVRQWIVFRLQETPYSLCHSKSSLPCPLRAEIAKLDLECVEAIVLCKAPCELLDRTRVAMLDEKRVAEDVNVVDGELSVATWDGPQRSSQWRSKSEATIVQHCLPEH